MTRNIFAAALLCVGLAFSSIAGAADLAVASWNIRNLGWGDQKSYQALGLIGSHFDLLAVQEVMSDEGLERLHTALEAASDTEWGAIASRRLGRGGGYAESYAFLWREDRVEHVGGDVVYLDQGDRFIREPYSARFRDRATGTTFVMATAHILYGDSIKDRTPEIRELARYWQWLEEVYEEDRTRLVLAGDFNLAPEHGAWSALKRFAKPLITEGATTLSSRDGRYANLYDQIWVGHDTSLPLAGAAVLRFPDILGWTHEKARKHVSDHAPVVMLLGERELTQARAGRVTAGDDCIDLNTAPPQMLERIIHIGAGRAAAIIDGRPWRSIEDLTSIRGIGAGRLDDVKEQGLVCAIP